MERSTAFLASRDTDCHECIDTMKDATTSIGDILNGVLCLQQIEDGRLSFKSAPFSIANSIRSVMTELAVVRVRKSIEIVLTIPLDAPALVVGDRFRFEQVVSILLGNAVKHSHHHGTVRINISVAPILSPPGGSPAGLQAVSMAIEDEGKGISDAHQRTIFGNFMHERPASLKTGQGPGLSLAICHGLVLLQGGTIAVKSVLGAGSTFTVMLPFTSCQGVPEVSKFANLGDIMRVPNVDFEAPSKSHLDNPVGVSDISKAPSSGRQLLPPLKEIKVLVVDDSATYRKTMSMLLKREKIDFDLAEDGQDCLNKALGRAVDYDLILMDNLMPNGGLNKLNTICFIIIVCYQFLCTQSHTPSLPLPHSPRRSSQSRWSNCCKDASRR